MSSHQDTDLFGDPIPPRPTPAIRPATDRWTRLHAGTGGRCQDCITAWTAASHDGVTWDRLPRVSLAVARYAGTGYCRVHAETRGYTGT